jgi:membrane-bound lytic murein transglycosylase B
MPFRAALILVVASCTVLMARQATDTPATVPPLPPPFDVWLDGVRTEAAARGISPGIVERALDGVQLVPQILERDRGQPEFTLDVDAYLRRRLTPPTVRTARDMYKRHRGLVQRVGRKYGIDPRVLIAVWGLESNFGRFSGVRPTIPTLATLAYDPRRGTMFRNELFNALEILDRGDIELENLKGSWAGALGQPQFLPSSYLRYAQDFDGDGRRDIWSSGPDVFASIAYYLQQHGWEGGRTWGREVALPAKTSAAFDALPFRTEGCRARRMMTVPQPLATWRTLGVRTVAKQPLPRANVRASLIRQGRRAFLLYDNYEALLDYNCAHTYALSVGLLADRL